MRAVGDSCRRDKAEPGVRHLSFCVRKVVGSEWIFRSEELGGEATRRLESRLGNESCKQEDWLWDPMWVWTQLCHVGAK